MPSDAMDQVSEPGAEPEPGSPPAHAHGHAPGPLPIPYTAEEVGRTFAAQLATFTFAEELLCLGIGRFSIVKRARARRHLLALSIALWHVALEKSFPNDADTFFERFTASYPPITSGKSGAKKLRELVVRYDELIAEKKDGDFTGVADTLVAALQLQEEDKRRQQLRISLQIRSLFEFIFEKLI